MVYAKSWKTLVMDFVFSIFKLKHLTLSMLFFKYLANILQHSSLNGCFHKDSEKNPSKCILIGLSRFLL